MDDKNYADMKVRLDAFSKRLDARIREFQEHGDFSDAQASLTEDMRQRHDLIVERLNSAMMKGATWDVIRNEFKRDFNALIENFSNWEKQHDARTMKHSK